MMQELSFIFMVILGFTGGVHCVGMCGGLSTAFTLNLANNVNKFFYLIILNLGRIISYMLIGALLGGFSQFVSVLDNTQTIKTIFYVISNILLIFFGLYLIGVSNTITKLEIIGVFLWKRINPFLAKFLPIKNIWVSFVVGMIWGWIPCGLVYSASTYALFSGSFIKGALLMGSFGLGTFPNLLATGFFANELSRLMKNRYIGLLFGFIIIIFACYQLVVFFI